MHFPPDWLQEESPEGAAHAVLQATEKPLLPCIELRSLHKGPFSFPTALSSPASYYLSPANNVSQERPPRAAATELAIHCAAAAPARPDSTKRRQGLSQFGSLQSEKEPFCFICCFSKCVSVRQREIQVDRNPSSGTHRPLKRGWHSLQSSGCSTTALPDMGAFLLLPRVMKMVPKAWEFGPVCLDHAAQWSLPSANTVPTQTPTLVLTEYSSSMIIVFLKFFFSPPLSPFLGENSPFSQCPSLRGAAGTNSAVSIVQQ